MGQQVFYYNGQPVQWVDFNGVQTFMDDNGVVFNNMFNNGPIQFSTSVKPEVIVDVEWHEVEDEEEPVEEDPTEEVKEEVAEETEEKSEE